MKIGRKGFMLVEVVVVAVVIATVLVTLFTGVNNVSSAYETRNRYYDVDSLYIAMEINDLLLKDGTFSIDNSSSIDNVNVNKFINFYASEIGDSVYAYITPYDKDKMLLLHNSNKTFSDYLDYLSANIDFSDENYNYMIIVERREDKDINDCYYYALKLKK